MAASDQFLTPTMAGIITWGTIFYLFCFVPCLCQRNIPSSSLIYSFIIFHNLPHKKISICVQLTLNLGLSGAVGEFHITINIKIIEID